MKLAHLTLAATAIALLAAVPAQAETIKIGLQPWLGYGPLWIAEAKGFFKEQGVDAALVNFSYDQDIAAALASGNIQVTSIATNGVILQRNNGVDLRGFMLMDGSTTADAVLAGKSIKSIAEIKGKKVAFEVGATSDLLINYALNANGMTIKDVEAVPINASDAGLALIANDEPVPLPTPLVPVAPVPPLLAKPAMAVPSIDDIRIRVRDDDDDVAV